MKYIKILFIVWALSYGLYYNFIGGNDISYWARFNYTNGALYLSYFHATLVFLTILISFWYLIDIIVKILKKFLVMLTLGHKKEYPILVTFSLRFLTLVKYLWALLIASFFIKENYITRNWLVNIQIIVATTLAVYFLSWVSRILLERKFQ